MGRNLHDTVCDKAHPLKYRGQQNQEAGTREICGEIVHQERWCVYVRKESDSINTRVKTNNSRSDSLRLKFCGGTAVWPYAND